MKVRVIADMLEEQWPSMDLFGEMLVRFLPQTSPSIDVELFRLPLKRRMSRVAGGRGMTLDRLMGRHIDYPRELRRRGGTADIDHIVDQTYAAAALFLRNGKTVVTCHDLDVFSPLATDSWSVGNKTLSILARRTLAGLRAAAHVACVSETVKRELISRAWLPDHRISVIRGGVHPALTNRADSTGDKNIERLLGPRLGPEILHVGSTIPRKRIDILFESFARVRKERPGTRLLHVGGPLTDAQRAMATRLGLNDLLVTIPFQSRRDLAALYRRAMLVVLPSQSEGFGLPLIEAMACGTPVLASDLEVFHEVAGPAVDYAPVGDSYDWAQAIIRLLDERSSAPDRWNLRIHEGLLRSRLFSWEEHARRLSEVYSTVLANDFL